MHTQLKSMWFHISDFFFFLFLERESEGEMQSFTRNWMLYWLKAIFESGVELDNVTAL